VPREQADCSGEGYGTLVCVGVAIRMPMSPQRDMGGVMDAKSLRKFGGEGNSCDMDVQ
jgi:hypothetical protein